MEIICRRCAYKWDYKGSSRRISCSKCKTSIIIDNHKADNHKAERELVRLAKPIEKQITLTNRYLAEVKFPKTLWKDARLSQRMMGLDNMGEKWIVLKVGEDGILSLT